MSQSGSIALRSALSYAKQYSVFYSDPTMVMGWHWCQYINIIAKQDLAERGQTAKYSGLSQHGGIQDGEGSGDPSCR